MINPQILVVDRNIPFSANLQLSLAHLGYSIVASTSEEDIVLPLAQYLKPDAVILEMSPHLGNPYWVALELKRSLPKTKIILHTEHPSVAMAAWAAASQVAALVMKTKHHRSLKLGLETSFSSNSFYLEPDFTRFAKSHLLN